MAIGVTGSNKDDWAFFPNPKCSDCKEKDNTIKKLKDKLAVFELALKSASGTAEAYDEKCNYNSFTEGIGQELHYEQFLDDAAEKLDYKGDKLYET